MDATSFQFTMTMPGDARLMETVRDLTAHAAKYAELAEPDARALIEQVLEAATVSSAAAGQGAVAFSYERTPARLDVAIEWDGHAPVGASNGPASVRPLEGSTSVRWSHQGHRQRCLVSHVARA